MKPSKIFSEGNKSAGHLSKGLRFAARYSFRAAARSSTALSIFAAIPAVSDSDFSNAARASVLRCSRSAVRSLRPCLPSAASFCWFRAMRFSIAAIFSVILIASLSSSLSSAADRAVRSAAISCSPASIRRLAVAIFCGVAGFTTTAIFAMRFLVPSNARGAGAAGGAATGGALALVGKIGKSGDENPPSNLRRASFVSISQILQKREGRVGQAHGDLLFHLLFVTHGSSSRGDHALPSVSSAKTRKVAALFDEFEAALVCGRFGLPRCGRRPLALHPARPHPRRLGLILDQHHDRDP